MYVKPKIPGDVIHIPERDMRVLSQDGEEVADNQFWFRRLLFGDVVEVPKENIKQIEEK